MSIVRRRGVWFLVALAVAVLMGSVLSTTAYASTRRVCFKLKSPDSRHGCPSWPVTNATRVCNAGIGTPRTYLVGFHYELWDRDADGNDEFIGAFIRNGTGKRCAVFEWEGSSAFRGEPNPDVYVKLRFLVNDLAGNLTMAAHDATSVTSPWDHDDIIASSAFPIGTTRNTAVFNNCTNGSDCNLGTILAGATAFSARNLALMGLDAGFRGMQAFSGAVDTRGASDRHVRMFLVNVTDTTDDLFNGGYASDDDIVGDDARADDAHLVPHELGHVIHQREKDDERVCHCDYQGDGHTFTSEEHETEAVAEGFAEYVSTRSWWDPESWSVLSPPNVDGFNMERWQPAGGVTNTHKNELQCARAFWDLDDEHNGGGPGAFDDSVDWASTRVLNEWGTFDVGALTKFDDRGAVEFRDASGSKDDDDGVNFHDYDVNVGLTAAEFEASLQVNQLTNQDPN